LRYKYIAYKYSRRSGSESVFHGTWDSFGAWSHPSRIVWRPATDVFETRDELVVVMELAGVTEDDLSVTLFSDLLVVEGIRHQPSVTKVNAYHQLGIKYGEFRSEVHVPFPVDTSKVKAEYSNGLLRISLTKLD